MDEMLEEEYNQKLESLRKYVPFLMNMMTELKAKGNREAQLNKIQSLHDMITNSVKKLKLETLNRCEEVLNNIYFKVNPQLRLKGLDSPQVLTKLDSPKADIMEIQSPSSTPASPSPPPTVLRTQPVTIPTEKVMSDTASFSSGPSFPLNTSHLPKVNVYSNVVINSPNQISKQPPTLVDMSKPPISLDDLKTLEEDVQQKLSVLVAEDAEEQPDRLLKNKSIFSLQQLERKTVKEFKANKPIKVPRETERAFGEALSMIDSKSLSDKQKKMKNLDKRPNASTGEDQRPADKSTENDKTVVYKRLADKYHPKPRQKPLTDNDKSEKNVKINSTQPLLLDNSIPPVNRVSTIKPLPDETAIRRRNEPSSNIANVSSIKPLSEPSLLPPTFYQLLSPNSILSGTPSPVYNPSPRPSPIHPSQDMGFAPRAELDFEPINNPRDPRFSTNPQMYLPQTPNSFPPNWNNAYYGNSLLIDPNMYTECQWNESYNRLGLRPGDPRSYKEYKEMKEREAKASQDKSKEIKDPRLSQRESDNKNPVLSKESISRDPRLARFRDNNKGTTSREALTQEIKLKSATTSAANSKFDKIYSSTNKTKLSSEDNNSFLSPLNSLYSVNKAEKLGAKNNSKFKKFKIPKKRNVKRSKLKLRNKYKDSSDEELDITAAATEPDNDSEEENVREATITSPLSGNKDSSRIEVYLIPTEEPHKYPECTWLECSKNINEFVSEYETIMEIEDDSNKISHKEDALTTIRSQLESVENGDEVEEESIKDIETDRKKECDSSISEPPDQKILAHFFENLLKSKDKKEKKTALFSLIETFSDSFDEKEIQKIRNIIKDPDVTEVDDHNLKQTGGTDFKEEVPEVGSTTDDLPEVPQVASIEKDTAEVNTLDTKVESSDNVQIQVARPGSSGDSVQPSVREQTKGRKRTVGAKPKKKLKTELDMLHDDIQEMFIRDGVLTANGKRMCRILKDSPNALEGEDHRSVRSKPYSKPKVKSTEIKDTVREVRILIDKMPDDVLNASMRQLRNRTRKTSYVESSGEDDAEKDESPAVDAEASSEEEDRKQESTEISPRSGRRKSRRGLWASGILPKKQRKSVDKVSQHAEATHDKSYYFDYNSKSKIQCKLCNYKGLWLLTSHYLREHPSSEVLCSRLNPQDTASAISDYAANLGKYTNVITKLFGKFHYACRLCHFSTYTTPIFFYEHVTTHTGEYRYSCHVCPQFNCATRKSLASHYRSQHPEETIKCVLPRCSSPVPFAYICGECNYLQLNKANVSKHVTNFHPDTDTTIFKISMSKVLDDSLISPDYKEDTGEAKIPYKKPGPKSKTMPGFMQLNKEPERSESRGGGETPDVAANSEEIDNEVENQTTPKKKKPGPKSKTCKPTNDGPSPSPKKTRTSCRNKARAVKSTQAADGAEIPANPQPASSPNNDEVFKEPLNKKRRRSLEKLISEDSNEDLDSIITLSSRTNRAAKDKATAKLRTLMENHEYPVERPSSSSVAPKDQNPEALKIVEDEKDPEPETPQPDLNVFTCKTDIMEEDAKMIEEERLRKMDELTKSIGSRQSKLDFVDKLCDRLNNEKNDNSVLEVANITVKSEYIPEANQSSSPSKICLNSPKSQCKKPILDEEILPKSNIEFKQNKSLSLFSSTIEKLQGKVNEAAEQEAETAHDPPVSSSTESVLAIGDIMKAILDGDSILYCCSVDQCYVSTNDKITFQLHCKFGHNPPKYKSSLCQKCNISLNSTAEHNILEIAFDHLMTQHSDFLDGDRNNKTSQLRMRKLSADKLTIKSEKDPVENTATLETSEENPFSFKIVDVMSLAENTQASAAKPPDLLKAVPPLTPITQKPSPVLVKEAKLTVSELSRPRKAQKALSRFIENPGELYKCPHLYCMFGTNVRTFFERHIKIHEGSGDSMVPCVYCNIKTPWEHVPIHIDIRHAHCQYTCRYCLYRAISKEYVYIHQHQNHQGQEFFVVQLPKHKIAKQFSVNNLKFDYRSLCEPFRCGCKQKKDYLFENEFELHLMSVHGDSIVACGFPGCTHQLNSFLMLSHWSTFHGLSTYQCGYCKTSGRDESKMYMHFVKIHPSFHPHLVVRSCPNLPVDKELGYTEEAFLQMRHIEKLPSLSTILGKKFVSKTKLWKLSNTVHNSPGPSNLGTPLVLQPVAGLPPRQGGSPTKILLSNPNVKLLVTTSSSEKLYLVPTANISNSKFITSVAPANKVVVETSSATKSTLGGNISTLIHATAEENLSKTVENRTPTGAMSQDALIKESSACGSGPPPLIYISEKSSPITPVEHVVVPDANVDDGRLLPEESDPLVLDRSVNERPDNFHAGSHEDPLNISILNESGSTFESAVSLNENSDSFNEGNKATTFSASDDDADNKLKHSGLSGLQLYRCAVCSMSFSIIPALKHHLSTSTNCKKPGVKPYQCFHCSKMVKTPSVLVDHLQTHGVQRFICSLCNDKFTTLGAARAHNKSRHSIHHTTLVPLDNSKTDVEADIFVVKPTLVNVTTNKDSEGSWENPLGRPSSSDNVFLPDQIDKIPIRQIFNSNVKCGLCNYQTKVRVNIVRHLQMHSEEKSVPDIAPVNPVPCLEKNEKMFDKMINLAASSITGRMGVNKTIEKEEDKYPEFVPTHCRFVCCASGCSYLCPEEANLKHHLMALHSDDTNFTCAHCKHPISPTDADSVIKHFKLHGLHLYKCQHCKFIHHLKHKVEKHIVDSHLDATGKVITLRYMESEPVEGRETEESQLITTPHKQKPWRCCMCKAKFSNRQNIQSHILSKHDVDAQYKCTLCAFKNNEIDSFENHFAQNHPGHKIDIIYVYQKIDEETPKDESFDTTPLWQRDKPRIRHIRGILFDEASPQPSRISKKTPKSAGKDPIKNVTDCIEAVVAKGTRAVKKTYSKMDPSAQVEQPRSEPEKKENMLEGDDDVKHIKIEDPVIVIDSDESDVETKSAGTIIETSDSTSLDPPKVCKQECEDNTDLESNYSKDYLISLFGDFGTPHKKQWRCPKCHQFKSRRVADFIYHIYKDYNVYRFKCRICNDLSITYKYMLDHLRQHHGKSTDVIETLPANVKLETWIHMVIREQTISILNNSTPNPIQPLVGQVDSSKCFFCDEKFPNMGDCCEHMLSHWAVMPYQCDQCQAEFYNVIELKNHSESLHPNTLVSLEPKGPTLQLAIKCCDSINKRMAVTPDNNALKKMKVEETQVKIDLDPVTNTDTSLMETSLNSSGHSENQVFSCDICLWVGTTSASVLEHLKSVHSVYKYDSINQSISTDNFTCHLCKQSFSEIKLGEHFSKFHSDQVYKHKCYICGKKYMLAGRLKTHLMTVHSIVDTTTFPDEQKLIYKCTVCSYVCIANTITPIRLHLRGHFPAVMCLVCKKLFKFEKIAESHHRKQHPGKKVDLKILPDVEQEFIKALELINKNATKLNSTGSSGTSSLEMTQEEPAASDEMDASNNLKNNEKS